MSSAELYQKLKNYWAYYSSGFSGGCGYKEGKRYIYVDGPHTLSWHKLKWQPRLPEKTPNGSCWKRPTYEQFCFALGLAMDANE